MCVCERDRESGRTADLSGTVTLHNYHWQREAWMDGQRERETGRQGDTKDRQTRVANSSKGENGERRQRETVSLSKWHE